MGGNDPASVGSEAAFSRGLDSVVQLSNGVTSSAASSVPDTMPKSESRDELVYEIDRELGTAPQAVQAELVNLDVSSAASVSPPKAAEGLSDSDEDLNSMVVHEDQPQPEIKLSELIVREQHIHVIPEESPSDETPSPVPEANAIPEPAVTQNGGDVDQLVDLGDDTKSPPPTPAAAEDAVDAAPTSAAINVEQVVDLVSGLEEVAEKSVQNLVENPQVSEDLVDLASQVLQGDVLEQIEHSDPCKAACKPPVKEAPVKVEDSQYLFSADVGVHEEAIVPRAQPLLFDAEESSSVNVLAAPMDNLIFDEAPKVVDAIEKPSEPKFVDKAAVQDAEPVSEPKIEDAFDFSTGSIELDSVKDVVEKLSAANESREEAVAAPIIPDSIPQAEGVQDVDSESDNDAQEWSFVKPVDQQPPATESQEAVSATAAAAAVVAATSVAAAVVATTAAPTPAATPRAAEKPKAPARAAKSASASKPSPAKTPTSASSAKVAAVKASPKTTTPLRPAAKPQTASVAPSKPSTARAGPVGAKTSTATKAPAPKAPAPKPASARPAGTTKAPAPAPPKPSAAATSKAPAAPKAAASKPAPAKPVTSTTAKTTTVASTRPAVSARAPATSAAPKPPASRPASTKPPAPKAPVKPATTATTTAPSKTSSTATTKTVASTVRTAAPKPAAASTGVKKTTTTSSTASGAAPSASRVAAARVAAARTAVKTTLATAAATVSSAKPKIGAAKTASSAGTAKVAPKSPVKKAVKQEKKAPAVAPEEVPKENGSANTVSQTNGHASPHVENGSSEPTGPVPTEAPVTPSSEGQGDILV